MPNHHPFSASTIQNALESALQEVFSKLLRQTISQGGRTSWRPMKEISAPGEPLEPEIPRVVGGVSFTGDIAGLLQLRFELEFARRCTGLLHESDLPEMDERAETLINDAVGEITGMAAGRFGSILYGDESPCWLGLPSIVRGNAILVEPISTVRHFSTAFDCAGACIMADVFIHDRARGSG